MSYFLILKLFKIHLINFKTLEIPEFQIQSYKIFVIFDQKLIFEKNHDSKWNLLSHLKITFKFGTWFWSYEKIFNFNTRKENTKKL